MIPVYSAENALDARLVADELRAGGLAVRITGESLSGGVGELPAASLVQVWLESPLQLERARAIIEEYEALKRLDGPERSCPRCAEPLAPQFGRCWQCGAWL